MYVLGIESSCDETGLAIYHSEKGLLAHIIHSQIAIHAPFGGVVPELASRNHIETLVPLLNDTLQQAQLSLQDLDAIAYTAGPGLIGALLTGACFAKSLAFSLQIPAVAVHHLEAHLLVTLLGADDLHFPFLALLVSGGHTLLIEATGLGHYHILGESVDDAVGEAFDKTAKLLGLPYPGGPKLAELADRYPQDVPLPFPAFPRPMLDKPHYQFSFSGLKTHAVMAWKRSPQDEASKCAIAFAFQEAVVETLTTKCQRALLQTHHQTLVVAGGVGANRRLRQALQDMTAGIHTQVYFPPPALCTDNGAMVAFTGAQYLAINKIDLDHHIVVQARWPFMGNQTVLTEPRPLGSGDFKTSAP
ncbi:MAG: tRNA (adenosine(37)-N6)-threonylcarbamoyltransferase complex transferase subunit TsaD [Gammaproteobacteria bacterium]|nr:tRNA (adenosine(37)-N6)-threonylcarbamoyltransferase complex transferase subunit TsaD [Gammaproteobacteria bacterium]